MNGINIGKYVKEKLEGNILVSSLTEHRIYPVGNTGDVVLPCIVYLREATQPIYTKDTLAGEVITMRLVVSGSTYEETAKLAELIFPLLEGENDPEYGISGCRLKDASEEFTDNTFTQIVKFQFHTEY